MENWHSNNAFVTSQRFYECDAHRKSATTRTHRAQNEISRKECASHLRIVQVKGGRVGTFVTRAARKEEGWMEK